MVKKSFPLSQVYRLLEPGPVVMITTVRNGWANIMTMSWHTMINFEPPTGPQKRLSKVAGAADCWHNVEW